MATESARPEARIEPATQSDVPRNPSVHAENVTPLLAPTCASAECLATVSSCSYPLGAERPTGNWLLSPKLLSPGRSRKAVGHLQPKVSARATIEGSEGQNTFRERNSGSARRTSLAGVGDARHRGHHPRCCSGRLAHLTAGATSARRLQAFAASFQSANPSPFSWGNDATFSLAPGMRRGRVTDPVRPRTSSAGRLADPSRRRVRRPRERRSRLLARRE